MAILQWQTVATLGEFGVFDNFAGGDLTVQHTPYIAAGETRPRQLRGTHGYSNVTLSRAYEPERDRALVAWVQAYRNGIETSRTLTVVRLNDLRQVVDQTTYPVAKPEQLTLPEGAAGGNGVGEIRLTLAVEDQAMG